jgi:hypothetical protein
VEKAEVGVQTEERDVKSFEEEASRQEHDAAPPGIQEKCDLLKKAHKRLKRRKISFRGEDHKNVLASPRYSSSGHLMVPTPATAASGPRNKLTSS